MAGVVVVFPSIRKLEHLGIGRIVATFGFSKAGFRIILNGREKRALSRPGLLLEKSRLISAELADFPDKASLGMKVSKRLMFFGVTGEYRTNSKRTLVFGKLGGQALKIRISHPGIDEIWVSGPQATELESQLKSFINAA